MPVVLSSKMQMITAVIIIDEKNIIYYYKREYWNFIARNANKYLINALTIMENKYWNCPILVQSQVISYTRTQNRRIMRLSNMSVV